MNYECVFEVNMFVNKLIPLRSFSGSKFLFSLLLAIQVVAYICTDVARSMLIVHIREVTVQYTSTHINLFTDRLASYF